MMPDVTIVLYIAFGTADQIQSKTLYTSTGLISKTIDPNM